MTTRGDQPSPEHPERRQRGERRPILNIGPGLIIAIILAIVIGGNWVRTEMKARQKRSGPPIIERRVVVSPGEERLGPTPEIGFIIERRVKLGLSKDQASKLVKLQADWERYYGPRIAQANRAAESAAKYLERNKGRPRVPTGQIQDQAAPLMALSREISEARRSYWTRATNVLVPDQRKALDKEREADWSARKP